MTNPPYIKTHMATIARILKSSNFYEFLHIPVQSGSDDVLDDMRRKYKRQDFENLCDYMEKHVPGVQIMTDCKFLFRGDEEKKLPKKLPSFLFRLIQKNILAL